jgi:hypothetical protein
VDAANRKLPLAGVRRVYTSPNVEFLADPVWTLEQLGTL